MTKLEQATIKAVKAWCKSQDIELASKPNHIFPRVYVLGRPALQCLLVACPPVDAEPQIKKAKEKLTGDGTNVIHVFDVSLKAGDWCSTAYVCTKKGSQESIAIPVVE